MKRSLHERAKAFFINMGRKSRILKGPAILGLAFSMLLHRIFEYCRKGTKRFICAAFVLLCFMAGNSFAYPVFQEESGFVSGEDKEKMITAVPDSDIVLADEQQITYDDLEILEDEDVLEGLAVGTVLGLHAREHQRHGNDERSFGQLGGLKRYAAYLQPTLGAVGDGAHEERDGEQDEGDGYHENGHGLEHAAGHAVHGYDHERAHREEEGLLDERVPEASALVGQGAGGAEHLDERDDAEKEVDDPNDAVAHEKVADGLHNE